MSKPSVLYYWDHTFLKAKKILFFFPFFFFAFSCVDQKSLSFILQPKFGCHGQDHPISLAVKEVFWDWDHAPVSNVWMVMMFHPKPAEKGTIGPTDLPQMGSLAHVWTASSLSQ